MESVKVLDITVVVEKHRKVEEQHKRRCRKVVSKKKQNLMYTASNTSKKKMDLLTDGLLPHLDVKYSAINGC